MVEVFKTNVSNESAARDLLTLIHQDFKHYKANFDLDDCDRILRIESKNNSVATGLIIDLLAQYGFDAEILLDE